MIYTVIQMLCVLPSSDDCHIDRFFMWNQTKDPLNGKPVHCSIQSPLQTLVGRKIMLSIFDYTTCYKKLIYFDITDRRCKSVIIVTAVAVGVIMQHTKMITEWICGIGGIITDKGTLKYFEHLSQFQFIHQKSCTNCTEITPQPLQWCGNLTRILPNSQVIATAMNILCPWHFKGMKGILHHLFSGNRIYCRFFKHL